MTLIYYFNPDKQEGESEYYAPDSQWFVKKCENYSFAAKAGNNYELHNHNDVGSFIVAKNGRPLLMDLGSGAYTAKYFSAVRYEILEPSSRSHRVPVIDGKYQINGAEYKSTNVSCKDGVFEMDIAGAYGNEALRSLKRRFETYEDRVVMIDEIDGDASVTERFCTLIEPKMGDRSVQIEELTLEFDPAICEPVLHSEPLFFQLTLFLPIVLSNRIRMIRVRMRFSAFFRKSVHYRRYVTQRLVNVHSL